MSIEMSDNEADIWYDAKQESMNAHLPEGWRVEIGFGSNGWGGIYAYINGIEVFKIFYGFTYSGKRLKGVHFSGLAGRDETKKAYYKFLEVAEECITHKIEKEAIARDAINAEINKHT